jgi:uncharacterized protein (DUF58 family)
MQAGFREELIHGEELGSRYAVAVPEASLTGLTGQQVGRRAGSSIDFQDYREYQPGDDLRTIDWNVYGRTDKLTIKLFREEVNPHVDIVFDGSQSMNLAETLKGRRALQLAALLAAASENAKCTHALWLGGEGFRRAANDNLRPSAWDGIDFDSPRNLEEAFAILPPRLRRTGIRILISDLFWPGNPLGTLRRVTENAAATFVIQVVAEADVTPPEHGNIHLVDSESGESLEIFIDAMVEQRYRDSLKQHQQGWHEACRSTGARFVTVVAEQFEEMLPRLEEIGLLIPA